MNHTVGDDYGGAGEQRLPLRRRLNFNKTAHYVTLTCVKSAVRLMDEMEKWTAMQHDAISNSWLTNQQVA